VIIGSDCASVMPLRMLIVVEPAPAFAATGVATMTSVLDGMPRLVAQWIGRHVSQMKLQEPGFEVH